MGNVYTRKNTGKWRKGENSSRVYWERAMPFQHIGKVKKDIRNVWENMYIGKVSGKRSILGSRIFGTYWKICILGKSYWQKLLATECTGIVLGDVYTGPYWQMESR